jgi:hypothetical protein
MRLRTRLATDWVAFPTTAGHRRHPRLGTGEHGRGHPYGGQQLVVPRRRSVRVGAVSLDLERLNAC